MQIAICDDNIEICEQIEQWILHYTERERMEIGIDIFYDADRMMKELNSGSGYDLIFLDIEFPDKERKSVFYEKGIELGKRLRERVQCNHLLIDFISAKTEYGMQLFEFQPLNFRIKPLKQEEIVKDLEKACSILETRGSLFTYSQNGVSKGILVRDIVYIEALEKMIHIHTVSGNTIICRGTLRQIAEEYKSCYLCRCHRSFIVNLYGVIQYRNRRVTLNTGDVIEVGNRYARPLREQLSSMDLQGE